MDVRPAAIRARQARIARALNDAGIPCPSAADPARNPHRTGAGWTVRTVASILSNPRYTGRQVWNRQRTDLQLADQADISLGYKPVQRWNLPDGWVISAGPRTRRWSAKPTSSQLRRSGSPEVPLPGAPVQLCWPLAGRGRRLLRCGVDAGLGAARRPGAGRWSALVLECGGGAVLRDPAACLRAAAGSRGGAGVKGGGSRPGSARSSSRFSCSAGAKSPARSSWLLFG